MTLQLRGEMIGEHARRYFGLFGEHHRSVGGDVAVGGVARRLDGQGRSIGIGRKHTSLLEGKRGLMKARFE